jgi:hypothetical protein
MTGSASGEFVVKTIGQGGSVRYSADALRLLQMLSLLTLRSALYARARPCGSATNGFPLNRSREGVR